MPVLALPAHQTAADLLDIDLEKFQWRPLQQIQIDFQWVLLNFQVHQLFPHQLIEPDYFGD